MIFGARSSSKLNTPEPKSDTARLGALTRFNKLVFAFCVVIIITILLLQNRASELNIITNYQKISSLFSTTNEISAS